MGELVLRKGEESPKEGLLLGEEHHCLEGERPRDRLPLLVDVARQDAPHLPEVVLVVHHQVRQHLEDAHAYLLIGALRCQHCLQDGHQVQAHDGHDLVLVVHDRSEALEQAVDPPYSLLAAGLHACLEPLGPLVVHHEGVVDEHLLESEDERGSLAGAEAAGDEGPQLRVVLLERELEQRVGGLAQEEQQVLHLAMVRGIGWYLLHVHQVLDGDHGGVQQSVEQLREVQQHVVHSHEVEGVQSLDHAPAVGRVVLQQVDRQPVQQSHLPRRTRRVSREDAHQ